MSVLVGRPAPDFTAAAVLGSGEIVDSFSLSETIKGKKAVLFFYPLDFTFVCPSELIAFDKRFEEFKKRGVEVIGVSIDSQFSHNAWRNTPVNEGGIGPVQYTLVADVKHEICQLLLQGTWLRLLVKHPYPLYLVSNLLGKLRHDPDGMQVHRPYEAFRLHYGLAEGR